MMGTVDKKKRKRKREILSCRTSRWNKSMTDTHTHTHTLEGKSPPEMSLTSLRIFVGIAY